ncbi:MAG: peptide-methionine (S)-S-oxide reductase MsrA [Alphaproteobacteria bacterium]
MNKETAILAGGCFWGMQDLIRKRPGIISTRVGYTGGHTQNPTYPDICTGQTGHAEAIEITFDPAQTTYRAVLEFFFQMHDSTTVNQQGNDIGTQYRSAIFTCNEEQKNVAQQLIKDIDNAAFLDGPVVTQVTESSTFYEAEENHQDYLEKHPNGYTCHFIRHIWPL